jgi:signal recognition particle subunit SRP54
VGEQIGVDVHLELENKNPVEIAQNAIREARSKTRMLSSSIQPAVGH